MKPHLSARQFELMKLQEKMIIFSSLALIVLALGFYQMVPDLMLSLKLNNSNFIGVLLKADGDVRVRLGDTISWKKIGFKDIIYSNSYLFTGEGSSATIVLLDQTSIEVSPNSMLFINYDKTEKPLDQKPPKYKPLALELHEGKAKLDAVKDSALKKLKMQESEIKLNSAATLVLDDEGSEANLLVAEGEIEISNAGGVQEVKAGEKAILEKEDKKPEVGVLSKEELDLYKKNAEKEHAKIVEELKLKRDFRNIFLEIVHFFIL